MKNLHPVSNEAIGAFGALLDSLDREGLKFGDLVELADSPDVQGQGLDGVTVMFGEEGALGANAQVDLRRDTVDFRVGGLGPFVLDRTVAIELADKRLSETES